MNTYQASKNNSFKMAMIVVLIVVLLASSILVGSVLAWLTDRDEFDDGDRIKIGSVDFDIYNGNTKITATKNNADGTTPEDLTTITSQEIEITGGANATRNLDLTIRNTGTVAAIMRATIQIMYEDASGNKLPCLIAETFTLDSQIAIHHSDWINDFSGNGTVASGYTYYNKKINPYTVKSVDTDGNVVSQDITANAVEILSQILVPDSMKSATYFITISVEGVAHSGNIYQEDADKTAGNSYEIPVSAYPFGSIDNLPEEWIAWKND